MTSLLRLRTPRTIACIGRNYADHVKELGNTRPTEPFFFLKPATSLLHPNAGPILAPAGVDLHYEVELAAVVGKTADEVRDDKSALGYIKGWAVGVDMTARDRAFLLPHQFFFYLSKLTSRSPRKSQIRPPPLDAVQGFQDVPPGLALHPVLEDPGPPGCGAVAQGQW